jgi:hypothetical protein
MLNCTPRGTLFIHGAARGGAEFEDRIMASVKWIFLTLAGWRRFKKN